jgi:hypothetical protein
MKNSENNEQSPKTSQLPVSKWAKVSFYLTVIGLICLFVGFLFLIAVGFIAKELDKEYVSNYFGLILMLIFILAESTIFAAFVLAIIATISIIYNKGKVKGITESMISIIIVLILAFLQFIIIPPLHKARHKRTTERINIMSSPNDVNSNWKAKDSNNIK